MENITDALFLQQISHIEENLLVLDSSSLMDFSSRWFTFVDDLQVAIAGSVLEPTTVKAAFLLSHRVEKVTSKFLELELLTETSQNTLTDEPPPDDASTTLLQNTSEHSSLAMDSMKLPHTWLLDNLHNPYPSNRTRDDIARRSGCLRKDIDNWFIDMRKRIGWNALRRALFANKRDDIVDAATRFFIREDPERPLEPVVKREFAIINERAKDLYYGNPTQSPLSADSGSIPKIKAQPLLKPTTQQRLEEDSKAYPSPEHSPKLLSSLAPEKHDNAPPSSVAISLTRRKRCGSLIDPDQYESQIDQRPAKKTRLNTSPPPNDNILATSLPSPKPSPVLSFTEPLHHTAPLAAESSTLRVHKRRLSESSNVTSCKRPRNLPARPRIQTVSDPLPLLLSSVSPENPVSSDWLQASTSLNVEEPEPLCFGVEGENSPELDFLSTTHSSPEVVQHTYELSSTDLTSIYLEDKAAISQTLDSLTIGDIQSLLFNHPCVNIVETTPSLSDPVDSSFELGFSTEPSEVFMKSSHPALETSMPSFGVAWDLLDFPTIGSPDSVFDLAQPLDDIPHVAEWGLTSDADVASSVRAQAARAEKEKRLKEVQEEARRLELELTAEA